MKRPSHITTEFVAEEPYNKLNGKCPYPQEAEDVNIIYEILVHISEGKNLTRDLNANLFKDKFKAKKENDRKRVFKYYLDATWYLELISRQFMDRSHYKYLLTPIGKDFLEKKKLFSEILLRVPSIKTILTLHEEGVTIDELTAVFDWFEIKKVNSSSTRIRRLKTILSWGRNLPLKQTWSTHVQQALRNLGGIGHLKEIYKEVRKIRDGKFTWPTFAHANIRECLESHSSDSDRYQNREDLFYSVEGKGRGVWGLRGYSKQNDHNELPLDVDDEKEFKEGEKRQTTHKRHERNKKAKERKIEIFKSQNKGKIFCEACKFNFVETYGTEGIECHHTNPIAQGERKTRIEDLLLLCPNCHRIIHKTKNGTPLSLEELVSRIKHYESTR